MNNPLNHFGIQTRIIRKDTKSYNNADEYYSKYPTTKFKDLTRGQKDAVHKAMKNNNWQEGFLTDKQSRNKSLLSPNCKNCGSTKALKFIEVDNYGNKVHICNDCLNKRASELKIKHYY